MYDPASNVPDSTARRDSWPAAGDCARHLGTVDGGEVTAAFLLRRRVKPYPPLPQRYDRGWPVQGSFFEEAWVLLIALAIAGLVVGIAGRL